MNIHAYEYGSPLDRSDAAAVPPRQECVRASVQLPEERSSCLGVRDAAVGMRMHGEAAILHTLLAQCCAQCQRGVVTLLAGPTPILYPPAMEGREADAQ